MKYSAIAILCFIVAGEAFVILGVQGDRAGIVAMGIYTTFALVVIETAAAVIERLLQNAVEIDSEHDLTVWNVIMTIIINIDVMLAQRKMNVTALSAEVGIPMPNLSTRTNGKSKGDSIFDVGGDL